MKHLFLIDGGVRPAEWERHVPAQREACDFCVLSEGEATGGQGAGLAGRARSVGDAFPPSGRREGEMLTRAGELARRVFSEGPVARHLERAGGEFTDVLKIIERHAAMTVFFPVLRRIEAIREALARERIGRVTIVSSDGAMAGAFRMAAPEFKGSMEEIHLPSFPSTSRRLRAAIGRASGGRARVLADGLSLLRSSVVRRGSHGARGAGPAPCNTLVCTRPVDHDLYAEALVPVMRELSGRGGARLLDDARGRIGPRFEGRGMEVEAGAGLLGVGAIAGLLRDGERIRRSWAACERDSGLAASFVEDGRSLWPVVGFALRSLLGRELFWLRVWMATVDAALERLRPRVLLVCPDQGMECEAAVEVARRRGVPSFYLQPALIADTPRYGPLHADHAALIEDFSREVYLRRGVDPARLHLTGLGRWEALTQPGRFDPDAVRRRLGVEAGVRLVLFAGQRGPASEKAAMLEPLLRAAGRIGRVRVFVRPHPSEGEAPYVRFFPETPVAGNASLLPPGVGLHEVLSASDLVVTGFSNVALEAAILDRCVLTVNLRDEPDVLPFVAQGVSAGAATSDEIGSQVERILGDAAYRDSMKARRYDYFARNPQLRRPGANARIADLIESLGRPKCEGDKA